MTRRYWGRQLLSLLGVLVTFVYLASIAWSLMLDGAVHLHLLWLGVTALFIAERVITVRSRGWLQMLISGVLVIEMAFDVFLQCVQARAFTDALLRRERTW